MTKRPRSQVQSVLIHIKGDNNDVWVPKRIDKGSWVTLNPPKRGPWAKQDIVGQVKNFKFTPGSSSIQSILVSHAYYHRQLQVKSNSHGVPSNRLNYIYPTKCEDWQDPISILDVVVVRHGVIGEATRGTRTHKELLHSGILFYDAAYIPPLKKGKFGTLTAIPLPPFQDPSWPVPDMSSSESFRARLFGDFHLAMKSSTGGHVCRVSWFMPIHIMIDLFNVEGGMGMRQTKTLCVFKPASEALLASLMDPGWDVKIEAANDIIKCHVLRPSIGFRYHVGRQMLYVTFGYVRERLVRDVWVAMDQANAVEMMDLEVELFDGTHVNLYVGKNWGLRDLREEVCFYINSEDAETTFLFGIVRPTKKGRWEKINARKEKVMLVQDIGEGNFLRIKKV